MVTGFHHAQVTVPRGRSDDVRAFYGGVLGLAEVPVPDTMTKHGLIWFRVGDRELHVGQEDGVGRLKTNAHLAYHVSDMKHWRQRLAEHNIETFDQPKMAGYDRVHLRDPFGNRIEIIGPE